MLVEVPAQVGAWCYVEDAALDLGVLLAHVLVAQDGVLGIGVDADAEVVALAYPTELCADGLVIVAVLGELAQLECVVQHVVGLLHELKHGINVVAVGLDALAKVAVGVGVVDEGLAVVLVVAVVVAIAELQVGAVGNGFVVGELQTQVAVHGGRLVVSVVLESLFF